MENKVVKRTERGWAGHFIGGADCQYHRNTLLEYEDYKIVVSTIGRYLPLRQRQASSRSAYTPLERYEMLGRDRYFETMAFTAYESEDGYWDATSTQVLFGSNWELNKPDMEKEADEMHEDVVAEITQDLINGTITIETYE